MQLSQNFTLAELTRSDTALRFGLDNTPNQRAIAAMRALCLNVLQPLRDHFSVPVTISSGYRSRRVNQKIKGSSANSQHMFGEAVDFNVMGTPPAQIFDWIVFAGVVDFDQCILEFNRWVHVSYTERRPNRRRANNATRNRRGRVLYKRVYAPLTS